MSRKTESIKTQLEKLEARIVELPPLCTIHTKSNNKLLTFSLDPVDALTAIIDEMAGAPSLEGEIVGFEADSPSERVATLAAGAYETLEKKRN